MGHIECIVFQKEVSRRQAGYVAAGGSANGGAALVKRNPDRSPGRVVTVNTSHQDFGSGSGFQRIIGHESLHTPKAGLRDQRGPNGALAYKYGVTKEQTQSYRDLKGTPQALINPDHIMDEVY